MKVDHDDAKLTLITLFRSPGQARCVLPPSDRHVHRHGPSIIVHVEKRENAIVNRLNKTKVEREVNHEQERVDRLKVENAVKRAAAAEKVS